jgi:uncharacterized peroxidase-related enzyme
MAMIPLVEPARNEYLAELERQGKNNFFRMMAHKLEVLKNFVPLYGAIMGPGVVDRRTKELVYLAASITNECAYCLAAHRASAKKARITEEEIRAMETEQYQNFSETERAAIQYARDLTVEASANESGEALYKVFNDEQVVEITLVAAMANFTNRFNNGLGVQPEQ